MARQPKLHFLVPGEIYNWLVDHSNSLGESIANVVRQAIREYKSKHDKK